MRRMHCLVAVVLGLGLLAAAKTSFAAEADVLPKGIFNAGLEYRYYFPADEKFGPDGDTVSAAEKYNKELDSGVFPDLALMESVLGLPSGSATIGRSVVDFEYQFQREEVFLGYGVTDRLTVGATVPLWQIKNKVSTKLDTSAATVGKNPLFGTPGDPAGVPLIPIAFGGVPLNAEETKDLLSDGLDVNGDGTIDIPGYGYKRFGTDSYTSVGDIEIGGRYQYYKSADLALAATVGVVLPTGKKDDTDNLVDFGCGSGLYTLALRLGGDYTGIEKLVLSAGLYYELILPDKEVQRVPEDVNLPITVNKESVDRNIGDIVTLQLSASRSFANGLGLSLKYSFAGKPKDEVSGDMGFAYQSLEDQTDFKEHIVIAGISYSTMSLFEQKKFPIPLSVSLNYRNRFAAENVLKTQYVAMGLNIYF